MCSILNSFLLTACSETASNWHIERWHCQNPFPRAQFYASMWLPASPERLKSGAQTISGTSRDSTGWCSPCCDRGTGGIGGAGSPLHSLEHQEMLHSAALREVKWASLPNALPAACPDFHVQRRIFCNLPDGFSSRLE